VAAILNALEETAERIRLELDGLHAIREKAFKLSREIVMSSSTAIKHMHRHDVEEARRQLAETAGLVTEMQEALAEAPWLGGGGFVGDSEKEYVEAAGVIACLSGEVVPTEVELGVSGAVWLNGLSEVVGELRRHVLDLIREGQPERAEASLSAMEEGLRRRSDAARGMIERTRGDLTNALRQASLEKRLAELEERL